MTYPAIREIIRPQLMAIKLGESAYFPIRHRSTVSLEMADLRLFDGMSFKSKVDKTRNELLVTRLK